MKIRKNSFVYGVAYNRPLGHNRHPKDSTSLCRFFWLFLWSMFFVWPIQLLFFAFLLTVVSMMAFLCDAERPGFGSESITVPIQRWPTLRGKRIPPALMIFAGLLVWGMFYNRTTLVNWIKIAVEKVSSWASPILAHLFVNGRWIIAGLIIGYIILRLFKYDRLKFKEWRKRPKAEDSVWATIVAYGKAKKQKVCPLITFVEKE